MKLIEIHGVRGFIDENGTIQLNIEDVSRGLGFSQKKNGIEYVRWETVDLYLTSLGYSQQVGKDDFIPENIFYRLAMKARNEIAEAFQAKVADEILPSIRKHGAYMTAETIEKTLSDPDFIIGIATELKNERAKRTLLEAQLEATKPLTAFAESLQVATNSILIGALAKLLKQNGIDIGQNRLFEILRQDGYLMSRGDQRNMPTQRSMDLKLMEIKVGTRASIAEGTKSTQTTKITGKGIMYFINKFKEVAVSA